MIYRRTLIRELTATAIGLFLILLGILFTNLVLRLLQRAVGGAVAPEGILALLGFNAVFYLNILLSVAVFLTVLLTLSRWYRDSEMVVWFTSGQPLTATLKPILMFAAPFLVAIVALSLFLSPWAEQRKTEYEQQLSRRDEVTLIAPGLFQEFPRAKPPLVAYVQSIDTFNKTVRNVFLHSTAKNGPSQTTVAATGHIEEAPNGDRFVVLEKGRRYEGEPGQLNFSVVEFDRLALKLKPAEASAVTLTRKAVPTAALVLLPTPGERSELFWRLSVPLQALVLVLLAIPLSFVNPRIGRSANLVSAAFLYMLYSNCLNIVQSMIAQGKLNFWVGLALPHVIALLLVYLLFRHQMSITGLFGRLRRKAA
ncbi:MAG: LPS export ABC transporter permease LptF [Proteobacteria bacterium]|nr:LPS export ABC transporter permease LptF [Pseudomonadota bacterium]